MSVESPHSNEIASRIHTIRNQLVMIDEDLAKLYGTETRVLNQAVRRNVDRFPKDFMFQLTAEESRSLRSQSVTSKRGATQLMAMSAAYLLVSTHAPDSFVFGGFQLTPPHGGRLFHCKLFSEKGTLANLRESVE